ncbi:peptidoglycan DD-metalloendopeptidase family protein [Skermanella rosea]|uniref:murein hydrolase activator EnvC family protein n=1 Tax=Skermanella rosea TaxID=1817965 RepID=UPI0019334AB0|nr:peptidoglycan DD-metalloendopeptidase family protein [Skermanella rosea]UEM02601.1 peptidoglycan DD-metalloendopeptidase family protein [Skermanella rosea]
MRRAALAAAALLGAAGGFSGKPAWAQADPRASQRALTEIERQIEAGRQRDAALARSGEALERELEGLRTRLVQTADEAAKLETELTGLEETLRALEAEESAQAGKLDADRASIAELLGGLQRLSRIPPEAMIARPDSPVDTLRGALLLRSAVPILRERAEALALSLQRLADLRADLATRRAQAQDARTALAARQDEIAKLVERRQELQQQTEAERRQVADRMARLGNEAQDLRGLIERLEREAEQRRREEQRRKAEALARAKAEREKAEREQAARAAAAAAEREREIAASITPPTPPDRPDGGSGGGSGDGASRLPVAGQVTTRYGEADKFGVTSRGLTVSARPGAQVVAPSSGSIMFAGPFRGYGLILIVEHPNGYHSLIAGLGRIDTKVGQRVLAGEPLGVMGSPADGDPDLYFELRRNGQPINPQRGLPASDGKGQG